MEHPDMAELTYASCVACRHKSLTGPTCTAYPDGIPEPILAGRVSHLDSYPGDNGIRFDREEGSEWIRFTWQTTEEGRRVVGLARAAVETWNRDFLRRRWSEPEDGLRAEYSRVVSLLAEAQPLDTESPLPRPKLLTRWGP
mgnify:CR=1 FL=1